MLKIIEKFSLALAPHAIFYKIQSGKKIQHWVSKDNGATLLPCHAVIYNAAKKKNEEEKING